MATELTYSIGATGRDYATLAAFLADVGTGVSNDLVSDDTNILLEMYNDAVFTISASIAFNTAYGAGKTDATRTITIRPASGHGFLDNIDTDDPLKFYGTSKGVTLNYTSGYIGIWPCAYMVIDGLQFSRSNGYALYVSAGVNPTALVKNCIFDFGTYGTGIGFNGVYAKMENCAIFHGLTTGAIVETRGTPTYKNVTVIRYSDASADTDSVGIKKLTEGNPNLINCASFGHTTDYQNANLTNCASSDATGSAGLINLTAGDQFEGLSSSGPDARLKATSDLIAAGSNTGTTEDIYGTTRDVTTPDIGAYEYVASMGGSSLLLKTMQHYYG